MGVITHSGGKVWEGTRTRARAAGRKSGRKSSKGKTRRATPRAPAARKKSSAKKQGRARSPRAKKPKPPCKYGPRDPVTGRCPAKPKVEHQGPSVKDQVKRVVSSAAQKGLSAGTAAAQRKLAEHYAKNPEGTVEAARQLGAAAFKVAAAAALGYAIGNAITSFTDYMAPDERKLRLANAYRAARSDAAARLGRPLSAAEVSAMGETFKAAVRKIDERSPVKTVLEFIRSHISTPH